jgi:hypothetical protein
VKRHALPRVAKLGLACVLVTAAIATGNALGYFSAVGGGTAAGAVSSLGVPTLSTPVAATGGTVALTWAAVTAPDGSAVSYYVTRNGEEVGGTCPTEAEPQPKSTPRCTDEGLSPGTYSYQVFALWSTWTKASLVKSATVTVGPVAKFTITGNNAKPNTGAGVTLTITARDAAGEKVTTFTGSHEITFAGAAASPEGKAATVTNASGTAIPFGTPTPLTFTSGANVISGSKNGSMIIYRTGEAQITATEGSLTTPVPLVVNVANTMAKLTMSAEDTTPTAGVPDGLTIKAFDSYGNPAPGYTGTKNIVFGGPGNGPAGTVATVESNAGKAVNIGTATPITFDEGVAAAEEGTPGGYLTAYKASTTAQTLKATEGSISTPNVSLVIGPNAAATLTTTASATSIAANTGVSLTTTAKDAWGNTATGFSGVKTLDYTATGTAAETSPAGNVPTVANSSGTATPLGTDTAVNFVNGVGTPTTNKNGYLRLYKAGTASLVVEGEELTPAPTLNFTVAVSTGTKKIAVNSLTSTAGTISSPCFFACSVTGLTNAGTITASFQLVDEYGNQLTSVGAAKSVTVTVSGTSGSTTTGSPMTVPASGAAVTGTSFTWKPVASGNFTNSLAIASSGYTGFSIGASK